VNHTYLAGTFGTLFGLPLGIFLATSRAGELFPAPAANRILGLIVNATRSTPFIILVVAIVPLTRLIAGTSIGTRAAVVPLTIAAIPFIARVIEAAKPWLGLLVKSYQTPEIRDFVLAKFKGAVLPAW
jgi:D-methionine transport system permease protein